MLPFISIIAVLFYAFASWHIASRQFQNDGPQKRIYLATGTIALVAHSIVVVEHLIGPTGLNFSLVNAILAVSLVFTLMITALATRFHVTLLLPLCYGWSAIILVLATIFHSPMMVLSVDGNFWLKAHMILALLAYSLLVISTLFAGQMLFINNRLKSKDMMAIGHLPPLVQVEKQLFMVLALGTFMLLVSLLTGFIFLENMFENSVMHKTILSIISAVVFTIILWGHASRGWRGKPVFIWTLVGTSILSLAYFGSRFIREIVLGRIG